MKFIIAVFLFLGLQLRAAVLPNWSAAIASLGSISNQITAKQFGDSWTSIGWITGDIATNLQGIYGNAGSGYTAASPSGNFYTNITPVLSGDWVDSFWYLNGNDNTCAVEWGSQFLIERQNGTNYLIHDSAGNVGYMHTSGTNVFWSTTP